MFNVLIEIMSGYYTKLSPLLKTGRPALHNAERWKQPYPFKGYRVRKPRSGTLNVI